MTYRVALPEGGRRDNLDIIDPNSTAIQRFLRREGLAGYEPSTLAALLASFEQVGPGVVFVDVGANIGLYSAICAAMCEPSTVLALEPTPELAALARRVMSANDLEVEVVEAAASEETGSATLHLADATDVSNSLESGFKASEQSVQVRTMRLDDLLGEGGVAPNVLKIDVEGHEGAVLRGARETLERHRPFLVVEVLNRRGGRLAEDIGAAIDGLGYHAYELAPTPTWDRADAPRSLDQHRDWLLAPEAISDAFVESWATWRSRVSACTADRNSRLPLLLTTRAAFRRGGVSEVRAAFDRFRNSLRRS